MPKYRITAPDGKTYEVNAPDGASQDDVLAYVQQHYQGASQPQQPAQDPNAAFQAVNAQNVADSSGWDNFWAGIGKSAVDTGRGLQQLSTGLGSLLPGSVGDYYSNAYHQLKDQQTEANNLDAALMHSKSGLAGNITGQAIQAIAGGTALKGAGLIGSVAPSTYGGAALSGGAQGLLQPLSSDQSELSRLKNVGMGAGAGVLGQGVVNLGGAAYRGSKALLAPFFDSGQDQIVANTLRRFGQGAAANAMPSAVPGVNATLAEQTGDAGIAQLQRAVMDSDPAIARRFADSQANNNAARIGLLQRIAGTPDDLAAAVDKRDALAKLRYGQAFQDADSQQVARQWAADRLAQEGQQAAQQASQLGLGSQNPKGILADAMNQAEDVLGASPRMQDLAQRPAIQRAMQTAKVIAANDGVDIGDPMASLQGQHYIKMALDDALNTAQQQGIGKIEQGAIQSAKTAFVKELERQNPAYAAARNSFRDMSGPVNQLQVGQGLLSRVTSPQAGQFGQIVDDLGNPVLTPDRFGNAVKSLDQIAQSVTGQKNASAASILSQQQKEGVSTLLGDLSRLKVANTTGKSLGSNTVQNLASQNLLGEVANGIGLPGLANSGLFGRLTTPLSKAYSLFGAPDQIKERLASVLLNPQSPEAQAVLRRMTPAQRSELANYAASAGGLIGQSARFGIGQQAPLQR